MWGADSLVPEQVRPTLLWIDDFEPGLALLRFLIGIALIGSLAHPGAAVRLSRPRLLLAGLTRARGRTLSPLSATGRHLSDSRGHEECNCQTDCQR